MKHAVRLALSVMAGALLVSCAMRQDISLNPDGSGEATVRITLQKFFSDYLLDLAEFAGGAKSRGSSVFVEKDIRAAFERRSGVTVKEVTVPGPQELRIRLGFSSLDALVRGEQKLAESGIVTFRNDGGQRTLRLHLDRKNYAAIASIMPSEDGSTETIMSVFGPQEGVSVTEAEYLETMEFTLGEEGPEALKKSAVEIAVTVNGTLVSQKGGTVKGNTVTFRIPLLKVLMLDEPLDYEVVFR